MPQESLGYVRLDWTCPRCSSRNPGPQRTCLNCGAPQPENVQFQANETLELVKDEAELKDAQAGADIHCAFCGARNPAGTKVCSQCGADLEKGVRREVGQVVGAFQSGPAGTVVCPRCGTPNPNTVQNCARCGAPLAIRPAAPIPVAAAPVARPANRSLMIALAVLAVVCIAGIVVFAMLSARTEAVAGQVQAVRWERSIVVEALGPVERQGWIDEVPVEGVILSCREREHHVQETPAENAERVCGTPYTVDQGSGYGEVVQDCVYHVYVDYCEYTLDEWRQVDVIQAQGQDLQAFWPERQLDPQSRLGRQQEQYTIVFTTPQGDYTLTTSDYSLFQQAVPGASWSLDINALGSLVDAEPLR